MVDPRELLLAYVDAYRAAAAAKLSELGAVELDRSRLPSGWTPLELVTHLAFMERRWFEWGFLGVDVPEPNGDDDPVTGRWRVRDGEGAPEVLARLAAVGERTGQTVRGAQLGDVASSAGRFHDPAKQPPTLVWILLHVLQEYARHLGHLDVAVELAGGSVGE